MIAILNVAGCMDRIGTTTQGIQLARFIKSMDYDVAYIEMNDKKYIKNAASVYADFEEKENGMISVQGIDVLSRPKYKDIKKGGSKLDYLICDYGSCNDKKFDKKEFLEGGIPILVGGIKPNELAETEAALRDKDMRKAYFIFSFASGADHEEILENMGRKNGEAFFSPYIPDPFIQPEEKNEEYFQTIMSTIMYNLEGGNA